MPPCLFSRCLARTSFSFVLWMATSSPALADTPLNLLFFGNSFTFYNDAPGLVGKLAEAEGYATPVILKYTRGGRDLDYHLENIDVGTATNNVDSDKLPSGDTWDFVMIQELSSGATHLKDPMDFRADVVELYGKVADHPSGKGTGVTAVLYETWSYGYNSNFHVREFDGPNDMQGEITTNYALALADLEAARGEGTGRIATVGGAFKLEDFKRSLYDSDTTYHPSEEGSLIAAMVLYRTIYGEEVGDIDYASVSSWANGDLGISEAVWDSSAATADLAPIVVPGRAT